MATITFDQSVQLRQVGEDTFENVYQAWTWPNTKTVPGGLLLAGCAAAAYRTVPENFVLDSEQGHFLGASKPEIPMRFTVTRLSNGKTFAVRSVIIEQNGSIVLHATLTFVNGAPWTGPALIHSKSRQTKHQVESIDLDDLELGRGQFGSLMKFQRLGIDFKDRSKSIESGITTSVAHIIPPIKADPGTISHVLGLINLSDYHVLDCVTQLNNVPIGLPAIGDRTRTPQENMMKIMTSLNHSIYFHVHNGYRADELTYIEVETSWAKDGRVMLNSSIFSKEGLLIATCVQEAFYVLKKDPSQLSKTKL